MCETESHLFSRPDTGDSNESCLRDNQTLPGMILAQNFISWLMLVVLGLTAF